MKICIITAKTPFSSKETFILEEILALNEISEVIVVPRDIRGKIVKGAENINVLTSPLFGVKVFACFSLSLFKKDIWNIIWIIFSAINKRTILKNLVVLPKSIYLSYALQKNNIEHIHAHWGGTTGTMALIIHLLTGIPFSITFHRWDIAENNLIEKKVALAKFVRVISNAGKNNIQELLPKELHKKVTVIHVGVNVPTNLIGNKRAQTLKILNVGNLITEKGQSVFLQSLKILKDKNVKFQADIFGEGLLKDRLVNQIINLRIFDCVKLCGHVPHQKLLNMYAKGKYNVLVSTSFVEGIPVAFMEAMAYGIPIIANSVGGINELIKDGENGFLVYNNSPVLIAEKIISISTDKKLANKVASSARDTVRKNFNIQTIACKLFKIIN